MKKILLGLGNPFLCDDGVGFRVVRKLRRMIDSPEVVIESACVSGLDVLNLIGEFDVAVIIDAVQTPDGRSGDIYRFNIDEVKINTEGSPHSLDFMTAIQLGRKLSFPLPSEIWVYAIEAENITKIGETCTCEVNRAIQNCVERLISDFDLVPRYRYSADMR